jgi:hypothetical protein
MGPPDDRHPAGAQLLHQAIPVRYPSPGPPHSPDCGRLGSAATALGETAPYVRVVIATAGRPGRSHR